MGMIQDVTYGLRSLRQHPGFTAVAAASLALGIGANSAMFSFADALLMRPLAVHNAGEIVTVSTTTPSDRFDRVSYPEYAACRNQTRTLAGLIAEQFIEVGLAANSQELPQVTWGMLVSGNFLSVLGVEPTVGRGFLPEEDSVPGAHAVLVISDSLWQRRFHHRRDIAGLAVKLNGHPFTIIGVAPPRFTGIDAFFNPDIYVPLAMYAKAIPGSDINLLEERNKRTLGVLGRLKPGVPAGAAQAEFTALARRLNETWPDSNRNRTLTVLPELKWRLERMAQDAMLARMLMAVAGLVLIIACANVASLLVGRASGRAKEIAIRVAIGASRLRLVRQLLTENLLIALAGCAGGLLLALWTIRSLAAIQLPTDVPISLATRLDARVLLFSLAVTVATVILFGLYPAIQTIRPDLVPTLKGASSGDTRGHARLAPRNLLVIAQTALSVVLLIAAGLLVKSFVKARVAGPGFRTDHVLLMSFDPVLAGYKEAQGRAFYHEIVRRVEALPGVESAAAARWVLLGPEATSRDVVVEGFEMPKDQEVLDIAANYVDAGFLHTLATPLVRGRGFDERDTESSPRVVIVNEAMARRYWPGHDPIGKRIRLEKRDGPAAVVIGIARDAKYFNAIEPPTPFLYFPFDQNYQAKMTLHVHTLGDPAAMAGAVRAAVRSLDPNLPVYDVRTMDDIFENKGLLPARLMAEIVGVMGLVGLMLAVIGLYGVMAYAVSRRTREIGIRMAVGAAPRKVLAMVLRQGMGLALAGLVIGLAGAFALTRLLAEMLSGVSPTDAAVFVSVPAALAAVALASCYVPARAAAVVDPNRALRFE